MSDPAPTPSATDRGGPRLDDKVFRDVIGRFASGVTVITARRGTQLLGTTASAVTSLSIDPPMLLVCLNRTSQTGQAIDAVRTFAVNILDASQGDLAMHFASKAPDKFSGLEVVEGECGQPLLADGLAQLECDVVDDTTGGTHRIFLAEVRTARARSGAPLTYFRGRFGRFVGLQDDATYRELRSLTLERTLPLGERLELDELARRLGVERTSVFYALTRLSQEGLVTRTGPSTYEIRAVDEPLLTATLRARCALILGVVDMTIDRLDDEQVARVRCAAEAAVPPSQGDPAEIERQTRAITEFHEAVIGLAGNELLLETYRALSVPAILTRAGAVWNADWRVMHAQLAQGRLHFAEALERRDHAAATAAMLAHTEEMREMSLEMMNAAGGRV